MNYRIVTVPSLTDFVADVPATRASPGAEVVTVVRLCLGRRYDPTRLSGSITIPAYAVMLDLQGFNDCGDMVWLSESVIVEWGQDGPRDGDDRAKHGGMTQLHRLVERHLPALGYRVLPGRYGVPKDVESLNGAFDCAEWHRDEDGRLLGVRSVQDPGVEVYRVPIQEVLDWGHDVGSLRENLRARAFHGSDLPRQEQECEDSGEDFWRDRYLAVRSDGSDFVVYLVDEGAGAEEGDDG